MGVMGCNRAGCKNIMCDRHSIKHGYICHECFDELVEKCPADIEDFMNTQKSEINREAAYARFNVEFPAEFGEAY